MATAEMATGCGIGIVSVDGLMGEAYAAIRSDLRSLPALDPSTENSRSESHGNTFHQGHQQQRSGWDGDSSVQAVRDILSSKVKLQLLPDDPLVQQALSGIYKSTCGRLFFKIDELTGEHRKISVAKQLASLNITEHNQEVARSFLRFHGVTLYFGADEAEGRGLSS